MIPAVTQRPFEDRRDAGRRLAEALSHHAGRPDAVVLGLPRGGVPVAYEVAVALGLALDVFVVRKLGVPGHEELALGAVASGGLRVLNQDVVDAAGLAPDQIEAVTHAELARVKRQEEAFRGHRPPPEVAGRVAIVIDDGLATGATMRAAVQALRGRDPTAIVVAVPVAPLQTTRSLRQQADEVLSLLTPEPFLAVGAWYRDFRPVDDGQVRGLLVRDAGP